jgi:hypothetical protein
LPPAAASAQDGGPPRATLEAPVAPVEGSTFHAKGSDPAAPRTLVLWRWTGQSFLRTAETRSSNDGAFDFGLQPLPLAHADYVVTPTGEAPGRDELLGIERSLPAPIVADEDPADAVLLVRPARAEGEIQVRDAGTGQLLARIEVDPDSVRGTAIDLSAALPHVWPEAISIEQRLLDGRRSAREVWILAR